MSREYEYQFIDIDLQKIRKLIRDNGGKQIYGKTLMSIIVYNHPNKTLQSDSYIRVRNEGNKITFTVKTKLKDKFPIEHEVEMSNDPKNIEEMDHMLNFLGCTLKYKVEKLREKWIIADAKEIVFDSYPALPTYMEIEAETEEKLNKVTKLLNLDPNKRHNGSGFYEHYYGIDMRKQISTDIPLTFKTVNKKFGKLITKNKKLFNKTLKLQLQYLGI